MAPFGHFKLVMGHNFESSTLAFSKALLQNKLLLETKLPKLDRQKEQSLKMNQ